MDAANVELMVITLPLIVDPKNNSVKIEEDSIFNALIVDTVSVEFITSVFVVMDCPTIDVKFKLDTFARFVVKISVATVFP